ncbi:MAG: DNA alkylation repair protein [Bacteroidaceae bacterium]|nr:DNA alkylation repair protein [Bacteroidaceae bacterium]
MGRQIADSSVAPDWYAGERFADIQMLRYRVQGFEHLPLRQKLLVYYLSEAALSGRDILWDQNCRYNLSLRRMLETVYQAYERGDLKAEDPQTQKEYEAFKVYVKRVWFANGVHHHYSTDKFRPAFSESFLRAALGRLGCPADETLLRLLFDPTFLPKRVNQAEGEDLLQTSAMNYYAPDVTQREAEDFYARLKADADHAAAGNPRSCPPMLGLNSRLEHDDEGRLHERVWKVGGMYGEYIERIVYWLRQAMDVCESEAQRAVISTLVDFYTSGDLHTFDEYTILWVQQTGGDVDFTNGFTEVYGDPLGLKASWEGYVNLTDREATARTERLSSHAQWFEDHSPVAPQFRKAECRGVSAKVVKAAILGGDLYPASAIGINLPNSNWVRQEYGSKSVTIGNLTEAYAKAARGNGFREEFVIDPPTLGLLDKYEDALDDLHTDLHECLGHGSGRLLPDTAPDALGVYGSTLEEARADLFALYYIADPKMLELGLVPDLEAYKAQYYSYLMNGLLTQLVRIEPGQQTEEAHMRNRALIARWLLAHAEGAMELVQTVREGQDEARTFLRISDYAALRRGVACLLAEVQRIKSEGDFEAARRLVEDYGVRVDPVLHAEVRRRYEALDLAPYKGFINPRYVPLRDMEGRITDIRLDYGEEYDKQMLRYSRDYSQPSAQHTADVLREIKKELRANMNGVASQKMREGGLAYHVNFGVELPRLRQIADEFMPSHEVAQQLWHENVRESKILAAMLMPVDRFLPDLADIWAGQIPNAEIAQATTLLLFSRLPYAPEMAFQWMASERDTLQLCGLLLLGRLLIRGAVLNERSRQEALDQASSLQSSPSLHVRRAAANLLARLECPENL